MKSSVVSLLLCASVALAGSSPHKHSVFQKRKPTIEKRVPTQPFQHPALEKRASSFLNDKSKRV
jgi:carboxypeptidase D